MALAVPLDEDRVNVCCGKVVQVLLSVCGLFICLSYGLMFGWPCHYFAANFRDADPTIDIPFNVAPLLAGSLMMGDILGTILSYFSRPNAKHAMVVGGASMVVGWATLWQSRSIEWFFASRAFIGIGLGLTTFNLRIYIEDICDSNIAQILTKSNVIFAYFGVFLSTLIGYLDTDIPTYGLFAVIITLIIVCVSIALPQTPTDLYQFGDVKQARWLRSLLNPKRSLDEDLAILEKKKDDLKEQIWTDLLVKPELRCKFLVLFVSCFLQQFTGMPATIVFGEFIYEKFGVSNPNLVTVFYMIILLTVYIFSTLNNITNKKLCIIISSSLICINFLTLIALYYLEITKTYPAIVIVCMYLFIALHTFGLGSLTSQVCIEMFPTSYKRIVMHFVVMFNAMWAILVGKTFQVLYSHFNLYGPFTMYTIMAGVAALFIWLFVHKFKDTDEITTQNGRTENGTS